MSTPSLGQIPPTTGHQHHGWLNTLCLICIIVAIATGITLRFWNLGQQSLWYDEGYSAWQSTLSASQIISYSKIDTAPPLYHLLLHSWTSFFGHSEFALRSLSALAASLAFIPFLLIAWKILKNRWAIAAALWLFALSPLQIQYAQEARYYALISFLGLTSIWCLLKFVEQHGKWAWIGLILSAAANLYLHNTTLFYLLGLDLAWLLLPRDKGWFSRIGQIALANAVILLLYLPWLAILLQQVKVLGTTGFWMAHPDWPQIYDALVCVCGFKYIHWPQAARRLMYLWNESRDLRAVGIIAAAILILTVFVPQPQRKSIAALALFALASAAAMVLYSLIKMPIFSDKGIIITSAFTPILMAGAVTNRKLLPSAIAWILMLVVILLSALSANGYYRQELKEDWRDAIAHVQSLPADNRLLVFLGPEGKLLYDYYARALPGEKCYGIPDGFPKSHRPIGALRILREDDLKGMQQAIAHLKPTRIVLIHATEHLYWQDPDRLVKKFFDQNYKRVSQQQFWQVEVIEYISRN